MTRVLAAVPDLFFKARISAMAVEKGAEVAFLTTSDAMAARAAAGPVDLVIVDLNAAGIDPIGLVRALRTEPALAGVRIVGFLSHVDVGLKRAAEAAGVDEAMPRSRFVESLAALLGGARGL